MEVENDYGYNFNSNQKVYIEKNNLVVKIILNLEFY